MTKYISRAAIAAAALALGVSGAYAVPYSTTSQMNVGVTVIPTCTVVTPENVTFDNVVPGVLSIQSDKTATITVTCTASAFNITADVGQNPHTVNDATSRQMERDGHFLKYHLYLTDLVTEWGNSTNGGSPIADNGPVQNKTYPIRASMPPQTPDANVTGAYWDTVNVVITN
jgi:spore coat protein U-like protein